MYYSIGMADSGIGPFTVYGSMDTDFYDEKYGNSFIDKDEAEAYCFKLNKILWQNGFKFKDKNGNDVHIGDTVHYDDSVEIISEGGNYGNTKGGTVTVASIALDGQSFCFIGENGKECFIQDCTKVAKVQDEG